jgi:hypothetical protein
MFRRQANATWQKEPGVTGRWILVAGRKRLFRAGHSTFHDLVRAQMSAPVAVGIDVGRRRWWMYKDEFFAEDEGLDLDDVRALAEADSVRRRRRVSHAHAVAHVSNTPKVRSTIPVAVRDAVWQRDRGRCMQCHSQRELQFDHIIPVAMGGGNTERNLQLLCGLCNRRKGASLG